MDNIIQIKEYYFRLNIQSKPNVNGKLDIVKDMQIINDQNLDLFQIGSMDRGDVEHNKKGLLWLMEEQNPGLEYDWEFSGNYNPLVFTSKIDWTSISFYRQAYKIPTKVLLDIITNYSLFYLIIMEEGRELVVNGINKFLSSEEKNIFNATNNYFYQIPILGYDIPIKLLISKHKIDHIKFKDELINQIEDKIRLYE